jgi:ubiquinone biosynthesis protein UbiJ
MNDGDGRAIFDPAVLRDAAALLAERDPAPLLAEFVGDLLAPGYLGDLDGSARATRRLAELYRGVSEALRQAAAEYQRLTEAADAAADLAAAVDPDTRVVAMRAALD